jgi:hypothetical protein
MLLAFAYYRRSAARPRDRRVIAPYVLIGVLLGVSAAKAALL